MTGIWMDMEGYERLWIEKPPTMYGLILNSDYKYFASRTTLEEGGIVVESPDNIFTSNSNAGNRVLFKPDAKIIRIRKDAIQNINSFYLGNDVGRNTVFDYQVLKVNKTDDYSFILSWDYYTLSAVDLLGIEDDTIIDCLDSLWNIPQFKDIRYNSLLDAMNPDHSITKLLSNAVVKDLIGKAPSLYARVVKKGETCNDWGWNGINISKSILSLNNSGVLEVKTVNDGVLESINKPSLLHLGQNVASLLLFPDTQSLVDLYQNSINVVIDEAAMVEFINNSKIMDHNEFMVVFKEHIQALLPDNNTDTRIVLSLNDNIVGYGIRGEIEDNLALSSILFFILKDKITNTLVKDMYHDIPF